MHSGFHCIYLVFGAAIKFMESKKKKNGKWSLKLELFLPASIEMYQEMDEIAAKYKQLKWLVHKGCSLFIAEWFLIPNLAPFPEFRAYCHSNWSFVLKPRSFGEPLPECLA